ncbi:MAG: DNA polymerase III subunit chi [Gammaproteobacteria bacterium]|nr:DNA polymerase III subunit chi [Gammaproteobacteria bacterium]MCP5200731.1 DNA polymerase III subunit chi [Gammaproteobacteria bacterium]
MTRVDFYVIDGGANRHDHTLCRVVAKAWQQGHAVYVQCADRDGARAFDDLLWTFEDTSFVPHALEGDDAAPAPIVIGTSADALAAPDVLLNLAAEVPANVSRFARVIESAGHDETSRQAARQRYRYYQDRGFPLHTHKLGR